MNSKEALQVYIDARRAHESIKRQAYLAYDTFKRAEAQLAEAMLEEGSMGLRSGNVEFRTKPFRSFYVNETTNDAWAQWLEKRGEELQDFCEWRVSKRRASEYARKVIETDGEAALPPEFSRTWDGITASGWKGEE